MLKKKYANSKENFNVIVQPNINGLTPDLLLISNNLIAVAELKSGCGTITGDENRPWKVEGVQIHQSRKNPFQQVHEYKFELLNYLVKKLKGHFSPEYFENNLNFGHIKGFVIFDGDVSFDHDQLSVQNTKWFRVTSLNKFSDDLEFPPKPDINLADEDVDKLTLIFADPKNKIHNYPLRELEVEEYEYKSTSKKVPISFEIKLDTNLSVYQKIINYYKYCLILEDLKSLVITEPKAFKIILQETPLKIKSFKVKLTGELDLFLKNPSQFSKTHKINLLMGYPIFEYNSELIPLFIFVINFKILDNQTVEFSLPWDPEIAKSFISKLMGVSDPDTLEFIKTSVDSVESLEDKVRIIKENISTKGNRILDFSQVIDRLNSSKPEAFLFWGSPGASKNVINDLSDLCKKSNLPNHLLSFLLLEEIISKNFSTPQKCLPFTHLNEEQNIAVENAFKKSLTVVTGPPGTGKTQVSLNILANAILNGKTVLFSAKNNKAVDDVCKKFDGLFSSVELSPILRIGNKETMALIPDKIRKAIAIIENIKKPTEQEIDILEAEIQKIIQQINEIHEKEQKYEITKNELDYLRLEEEYKRTLLNFEVENKKNLIEAKQENIRHLKNKMPEVFYEYFRFNKMYPVDASDLERTYAEFESKVIKKQLNFIEKLLVFFDKFYIEKKFRKIINKFISFLGEPQKEYISSQCTNLLEKLNLIKTLKFRWEGDFREIDNLERCVRKIETDIQEIKSNFNQEISTIKEKISRLEAELPDIEKNLSENQKIKQELLEKLRELARKFIVIKYKSSLNTTLIPSLENYLTCIENNTFKNLSVEDLKMVLKVFPVVATTNQSIRNGIPLLQEIFDLLVVDEASQSDISSALPLIYRSKQLVIIGDPMQLVHVVSLKDGEIKNIADQCKVTEIPGFYDLSYSKYSLFSVSEKIANKSRIPVLFLCEHFRSHKDIISFSNKYFYKSIGRELVHKTPEENLKFKQFQGIYWIHVKGNEENNTNKEEAEVIRKIINILYENITDDISIGITTPFRYQADFLQKYLSPVVRPELDVIDTVHRFQGDEKDIMIFSTVVTPQSRESLLDFINNRAKQLLNVAVTRARSCLIVVGDREFALKPKNNFKVDYLRNLAEESRTLRLEDLKRSLQSLQKPIEKPEAP
ncbi:MAG: AAA domain-containing protein [candidate division WOR-3 bacterium]